MTKVVIVGGGAAGMAVASRAKRLNPSLDVVVFERSRWVSFAFCGVPYYVGCTVKRLSDLLYYPLEEFTVKRGIDVRLETRVVDVGDGRVYYRDSKGREGEEEWDVLVLATGARSKAPKIWPELLEARNAFYVEHLDSGEEMRSYALSLPRGSHAVIVGAGYLGLEMAENLTDLGMKVTVVEALPQVAPRTLDPDLAGIVEEELTSHGVKVVKNAPVKEFKVRDGLVKAVDTEAGVIEGDMFIVGVGIEPNTDLARRVGARIGETGAIWVDERLRTSVEGIYAVGDAVETTDIVTGRRVWRPFAQVSNKMGYVAGTVIGGRDAEFRGSVGTSTFKVFDIVAARTGWSREEADKLGYNTVEASLRGATRAHYIPGGVKVHLKVVADRDTGMLLGAQAVGRSETVLWRINVIASLLTVKATVWDLFHSDIGYAPPLAPVWDPLIVASRLLMRELGERPPR